MEKPNTEPAFRRDLKSVATLVLSKVEDSDKRSDGLGANG
jgi:hypothetical protein